MLSGYTSLELLGNKFRDASNSLRGASELLLGRDRDCKKQFWIDHLFLLENEHDIFPFGQSLQGAAAGGRTCGEEPGRDHPGAWHGPNVQTRSPEGLHGRR